MWAINFRFDETVDGRPVKILNMTDEYAREALTMNIGGHPKVYTPR
jgi:hypothetical protein